MKKLFFLALALFFLNGLSAQENFKNSINVGDELIISKPSSNDYRFIDVPRKNFIIKRGGIANMASLENNIVRVTKITDSKNPTITIEKANGRKFFRVYRTLKANLNGAINNGELKFPQNGKKDSLAK
ncbi:hypothetical protein MTsPCn5_22680 [Croceitalea sp. MTPC5]|uniref:hypothetical protein n=1 Tax=Croceitalea sp. MTPC5 TaxID=3056565 RepID=UPI002B3E6301|nr:hypothetical protein MTsPCn5_22680 [Croceitalea sp. MTPC5]